MTPPQDLLLDVQRRLEKFYELEPCERVTDFIIGEDQAAQLPGGGSRTLVEQDANGISLAVFLEGSVSVRLLESDPRERLDGANLNALCTLTEEVSHFVYLLFCARVSRTVTELELELQGELDKYLTVTVLQSLQNSGCFSPRLRQRLFRHYRLVAGLTPEREERYRTASQLADRYCDWLERRYLNGGRFRELAREMRRFYRLGQREKLERIAALQ